MKKMHSLLRRQLKRFFGSADKVPGELQAFITAVNSAYFEFDTDREMLERSLDLSSQEMLQTNAEMRAVFQALPDMLFVIDGNGIILDHKAGSSADGYLSIENNCLGKRIQDIPIPEVGGKFRDALEKVKQKMAVVSFEYSLPIKGTINYYEARLAPAIRNQFIVLVRNITEQKLAEDELRKERDFSKTLVQGSPAFFVAINPQGRVIMMNKAMLNALDYELDEVTGVDTVSLFIPVPDRKTFLKGFDKFIRHKKPMAFENRVLTKKGNELLIEWHISPVLKNDGTLDFFFGVGIDITGRKYLEAQLHQAQKMEAIGTLAGGVAHDFNNLLMGIQGRTSMMLMNTTSTHSHFKHLIEIEEYINSATGLTKQLLGFAMGGKYEVKPTNMNDLIRKNSKMFGRTRKEVKIHTHYQEKIWSVEVDQGQLDQVLLNLYVNAGQAMPGGGDLYIQTENIILDEDFVKPYGIKPGKFVKISVTDTGVGIDKEIQQRIFDPFFTTKGMGRGTGLGLATAYGTIKSHDGIINVYSEKGKGATFTIYLPASSKKVAQEKRQHEEVTKGVEVILLIDDEEMILDVGTQMMEILGYKVMTAESGKQALELYKKNRDKIDLIVLDMIMPEINGSETFNQLKEINPDIKVILSSGYSLDGQAKEILDNGCKGFIQKPFTIKDLSQKLRKVLDQKD